MRFGKEYELNTQVSLVAFVKFFDNDMDVALDYIKSLTK